MRVNPIWQRGFELLEGGDPQQLLAHCRYHSGQAPTKVWRVTLRGDLERAAF